MEKEGVFICVVGVSGAGKSTLILEFLKKYNRVIFGKSATTRKRREGECEDAYGFISVEDFEVRKKNGEFLETALVHNTDYYGILRKSIIEFGIGKEKIVIKDIDFQGFLSIEKNKYFNSNNFFSIFLDLKDCDIENRILKRGELENLGERLKSAEEERKVKDKCDFQMESIQDEQEENFKKFEKIIILKLEGVGKLQLLERKWLFWKKEFKFN